MLGDIMTAQAQAQGQGQGQAQDDTVSAAKPPRRGHGGAGSGHGGAGSGHGGGRRGDTAAVRLSQRDIDGLLLVGEHHGVPYDLLAAALRVHSKRL